MEMNSIVPLVRKAFLALRKPLKNGVFHEKTEKISNNANVTQLSQGTRTGLPNNIGFIEPVNTVIGTPGTTDAQFVAPYHEIRCFDITVSVPDGYRLSRVWYVPIDNLPDVVNFHHIEVGISGRNIVRLMIKGLKGREALLRIIIQGSYIYCLGMGGQESGFVGGYADWLRLYDATHDGIRHAAIRVATKFNIMPKISVIMPTYNSSSEYLRLAIESVINQVYQNWELCIADDASTLAETKEIILAYAELDSRIKICFRENNGHISCASNDAVSLASGDYIALLDHDDELHPLALHYVVMAINEKPHIDLIYTDEDKIDAFGRRIDPYFKSDWNYYLFLSQNMISHLGVYRSSLVREVGGFREGYEGSQDYDLALRIIDQIVSSEHIYHIPRVLYHWRVLPESTAVGMHNKPYAIKSAEKALNDHFARAQLKARANYIGVGYRTEFEMPDPAPLVSIIITDAHKQDNPLGVIKHILSRTRYRAFEIIIPIPESLMLDDRSLTRLSKGKISLYQMPYFPASSTSEVLNKAISMANGEVVCIYDASLKVKQHGWLKEMVSIALQAKVGAVGPAIRLRDGRLWHGGIIIGMGGVFGDAHKNLPKGNHGYFGRASLMQEYTAIRRTCLVVKRTLWKAVGGFDEIFFAESFNDIDLCLKFRDMGYSNVWNPHIELHAQWDPMELDDFEYNRKNALNIWPILKQADPYFNPNLSLENNDFLLSWPPRNRLGHDGQVFE